MVGLSYSIEGEYSFPTPPPPWQFPFGNHHFLPRLPLQPLLQALRSSIATVSAASLAPPPAMASIIPSRSDLKEARSRRDGSATNPRLWSTGRHEARSLTPRRGSSRGDDVLLQWQHTEQESEDVSFEASLRWDRSPSRPQSPYFFPADSPSKTLLLPIHPVSRCLIDLGIVETWVRDRQAVYANLAMGVTGSRVRLCVWEKGGLYCSSS
ncbi:hypothetical protein CRG98_047213 [Punica granatum]|uniref:Uncharacterized protein n=1 Tax=Punica granatum TaxID=22663 RepID=A0A2I0HL12_PUNGR|nr:hypothetical protein CRG98_047213 [Punica granatum]